MSTHLRKLRGQIDPVLTNLAVGYKNAEFIAEKIFPPLGIAEKILIKSG